LRAVTPRRVIGVNNKGCASAAPFDVMVSGSLPAIGFSSGNRFRANMPRRLAPQPSVP
jgi:hypothetical protein